MPKDLVNRNAPLYGALLVGLLAMTFGSLEYVNVTASRSQTIQSSHGDPDGLTSQEWAVVKTLSPLPSLPVDTTNKYRNSGTAALLGQKLFFEPRLSGAIQTGTPDEGQLGAIGEKYKIACRNCHMPESKWLFDIRSNNGGADPECDSARLARG